MLLTLDEIVPALRCPRTGRPLVASDRAGERVFVASADDAPAISYGSVAGRPILVDFERSILEREAVFRTQAESVVVRRRGRVAAAVRRIASGHNQVAAAHCTDLIARLRAQADAAAKPTVLVVGGGTIGSGAEALYEDSTIGVVAFDIYATPFVQFVADAHAIPLADASVDAVWVQAVLEHVLDPVRVVDEIRRVLKPGGIVYAETPFMQQVHEGAFDFHRFTPNAHRWLFRAFETLDVGTVAGPGTALLWAWRYFVGSLARSRDVGAIAALPFFWLRYLDRWTGAREASDAASCVYFYGRRADVALTPRELIASYPGAQR
jgi:SAM-dependent methyltransferase